MCGMAKDFSRIICGKNAVMEALRAAQTVDTLYVLRGAKGLGQYVSLAKEAGAVVKDVSPEKLDALLAEADPDAPESESGQKQRHGGIAAVITDAAYAGIEDLFGIAAKSGQPPFFLITDGIEDPHNLGALIRTAECAGVHGVIIPKRRSAGLSGTVYTASSGAASWLPVCRVANIAETIRELKERNVWVYGADVTGEPYYRTDFSGAAALVIGSEGRGLSQLTAKLCDKLVSIDMHGKINSLNASVAGGILMYQVLSSRRHGN